MANVVRVTPGAWAPKGDALVREPGKRTPLMVWSGIPGEQADVRIVHQGQNQALGLFIGSSSPSPHRVHPPCERYTTCGGCALMHLDAPGQEQARRDLVRAELDAEGLANVVIGQWHPSPDGLQGFRHVIKVGAGYSDTGRPRLGAWGRRNRRIVPIPRCNVATDVARRTMVSLAHHALELPIRPYDVDTDRGVLRSAVIRVSRTNGEVLLTLVVGRRVRELQDLADLVAGDVGEVVGVWCHTNTDPGNAIYAPDEEGRIRMRPITGKSWIEEQINGISYRIGPGDFFQTNPAVAEVLYRRVIESLELTSGTPFVDLYSGVGGFALQGAKITGWALGIEENDGAVRNARESARRNGLPAEFLSAKVEEGLADVGRRLRGAQPVLAVNPARRGLEPGVIDGIAALRPRRVAYVSCNPRALARDVAELERRGLKPGEIELFDMFPNTPHVECLVVLEGPEADADGPRAPRRKVVRRA